MFRTPNHRITGTGTPGKPKKALYPTPQILWLSVPNSKSQRRRSWAGKSLKPTKPLHPTPKAKEPTSKILNLEPQETEELALEPSVVHAGVATVLSDPAKGAYFVLTVRACMG